MHLKQKANSFGFLLLYIVTTLLSAGRCESTSQPLQPASHEASSRNLHPTPTNAVQRRKNRAGGTGPELRLKPRMVASGFRPRFKRRPSEKEKLLSSPRLPAGNCSRGIIRHVFPGKFYTTGQIEPNLKHLLHQVDSALGRGGQARSSGQQSSGANESWQKLEPTVECGDDSMLLTVRRKRAMQLLLDRGNESSLLLFQLPPRCGYSVQSTVRDFSLRAQYDACHVALQGGSHVLPLLWRGIPVKVSCPESQIRLPGERPTSLCCFPNGMTFRLSDLSAEESRVNVRGEWTPLSLLAKRCGYTLHRRDAAVIIAAPFVTCGVSLKDGKHTLYLRMGRKTYSLACPVRPLEELPVTRQSLADGPPDLTTRAVKPNLESLSPLLWIPPFYLAPPNYPHPTYPNVVLYGSPNPPPSAQESALGAQQKHSDDIYHQIPLMEAYLSAQHQAKDSGPLEQNKRQHPEVPVLDLFDKGADATCVPVQVETPRPPPPGHDFSSYYHYYHLPKIPLPVTPQKSKPGPGASGEFSTNSRKPETPSVLPKTKQSDTGPLPVTMPSPHTVPTRSQVSARYAPYPLQPFPYFYYYFPHISKGEVKRLGLYYPDLATKTNLSLVLSTKSSERSGYDEHKVNPSSNELNVDKTDSLVQAGGERRAAAVTLAVQFPFSKRRSLQPAPLAVPPPEHVLPTPGFTYNADPYKYYYHPYYNYYLKYYTPKASHETSKHGAQSATTAAAPSGHKPRTTSPPSEHHLQDQRYLYYYYLYYLPHMLKYKQKLLHGGGEDTSQLSSGLDKQPSAPAAEAGWSGDPPPIHGLLSPSKAAGQHGGNGGKLDKKMQDTQGQYLVFAVPRSVANPSVDPPDNSKHPCVLQKVSSPDLHFPQDGCDPDHHEFGQRIQSHEDIGSSPGRFLVGCSSPHSSGEVQFLLMDQRPPAPPTPAAATVLMRITADESFSSFYPEAHLPLSLIQGRPFFVELRLEQPPEPNAVLLVHSCLAYTQTPELSWVVFYDSCSSGGFSQLLPSSDSKYIQRIKIPSFPSLPVEGSAYRFHGGYLTLEDPEVHFLCLTEICSTAHGDCSRCNKGSSSADP
uniref:Uncharacterized LOC107376288 n=1 Tax=Nothobranchius furzeri TaxID=105023 RepID=A0A8C6LUV1_NOTFU